MSNYKPRIESNNLDLTSILSTIDELPEAAKPEQTKTATPKASAQTVTPDSGYTLSSVTVEGDADLVAGNIKRGVSIFGVAGSYEGSGGGSGGSIETCTVEVTKSSSFFTLCQYSVVLYDSDTGIYSECFHQSSSGDDDEDDGTVVGFTEVIWSNVVCGTHLYIYVEGMAASINTSVTTSGGAAFVETTNCGSGGYWIECTAPTTAGAVATITVTA